VTTRISNNRSSRRRGMPRAIGLSILAAMAVGACVQTPPPIGRGLPDAAAFDKRVKARFPVASDESALRAEAKREGFKIETVSRAPDYQFVASRSVSSIPCRSTWTIWWNAQAGKIMSIAGDYRLSCL
jgi:hypothetical protein